ncbi:MAG: glutathione S-transferase family protein [Bdellovibrionales bacterium]|nr:glutathione S-transferase family protein [Bdellovibrionales bacterium]
MTTLYGLAPYDRGAKARWLMTEMGIPYESHWINRAKKENETPDYLSKNPMGRAPVLEIDGQVIFESVAICAYLADRFLEKGFAPALDSPLRAHYQQWMYFSAATLDPFRARIMIIEDIPEGELRTKKEAALIGDVNDAMFTLDRALSKNQFLVGERLTAADICVTYDLYFSTFWPEFKVVMEKYPNVLAYLNRMMKNPAANQAEVFSYEE